MSTPPLSGSTNGPFAMASGGFDTVQEDWMPASHCRPLVQEDACVLWLEWFGVQHGFLPSSSEYSFNDFLIRKGRELEAAWLHNYAKDSARVCHHDGEARTLKSLKLTFEMMSDGVPVILHPALWWAPERIYGVPDLIVLSTWLEKNFPNVLPVGEVKAGSSGKRDGHYIALDVKIKTQLDHGQNKEALEITTAQLGMYSYMLGQLQMHMPQSTFAICRDRVTSPLRIGVTSVLNTALDTHLVKLRDQWSDLRANGSKYVPWKDEVVEVNLTADSEKWDAAKKTIVKNKVSGGCPTQLLKISLSHKKVLSAAGFPSLQSLIDADPAAIPFDLCKGIGKGKTATLLKTILEAQRTGQPVRPLRSLLPTPKTFEFFVDYEFFQNENFDTKTQWPTLHGHSMVFMAGVGFEEGGQFKCVQFIAESESKDQELNLFTKFISFLNEHTQGKFSDSTQTAFYHWTHAEATQSKGAADNHLLPLDHPLRTLNWIDLNKVFTDGPAALPGCLNTKLKHVANALGKLDSQYDPAWPEELAEGLGAMVMGWKSYSKPKPLECMEMVALQEYLAADCRALWQILRWLRC